MTTPRQFPVAALLALLIGGTAIGFAGIMMRLSDVNPVASAFWRLALAAPLLWIWAWSVKRQDEAAGMRTDFTLPLALAGIYFAGDMAFWHLSLHYTTVSNATLLSNLAPIVIALWLWLVHRMRFARLFVIGIVTALAGAILLVSPNVRFDAGSGAGRMFGDGMGFISAVFYAFYQLSIKDARDRYSTARLMAWSSTVSALALLPFALMSEGRFFPAELTGWMPLIGLALIAQIGGQTVIAYASAHLPASLSSVGLLVQPLIATIAAWVLFSEAVAPVQIVGGALLLCGIYLCKRGS